MEITEYLPVDFRTQMEAETLCGAEEIRLRVGQPLEILYADEKEKEIGLLTEAHMREVLNYLSGYSVYALEEELRQGYFTLEGGHRIGVSGRASYEKHGTSSCMKLLSCISGLNIRLAHEKKGCASVLIPWLYCGENVYHTFFFAPPGVGKTTYLRDCIRLLSKGNHLRAGKKVGVVDERSEIAACYRGIPQNDLPARMCWTIVRRNMESICCFVPCPRRSLQWTNWDFRRTLLRWQTVPGAGYRSLEPYMPAVS